MGLVMAALALAVGAVWWWRVEPSRETEPSQGSALTARFAGHREEARWRRRVLGWPDPSGVAVGAVQTDSPWREAAGALLPAPMPRDGEAAAVAGQALAILAGYASRAGDLDQAFALRHRAVEHFRALGAEEGRGLVSLLRLQMAEVSDRRKAGQDEAAARLLASLEAPAREALTVGKETAVPLVAAWWRAFFNRADRTNVPAERMAESRSALETLGGVGWSGWSAALEMGLAESEYYLKRRNYPAAQEWIEMVMEWGEKQIQTILPNDSQRPDRNLYKARLLALRAAHENNRRDYAKAWGTAQEGWGLARGETLLESAEVRPTAESETCRRLAGGGARALLGMQRWVEAAKWADRWSRLSGGRDEEALRDSAEAAETGGQALRQIGRWEDAAGRLGEARRRWDLVAGREDWAPTAREARRRLALALAQTYREQNRLAEAVTYWREGLDLPATPELLARLNEAETGELAGHCRDCGQDLLASDQAEEAAQFLGMERQLLESMVQRSFRPQVWQSRLAGCLGRLARLLAEQEKPMEALAVWEEQRRLLTSLVLADPHRAEWLEAWRLVHRQIFQAALTEEDARRGKAAFARTVEEIGDAGEVVDPSGDLSPAVLLMAEIRLEETALLTAHRAGQTSKEEAAEAGMRAAAVLETAAASTLLGESASFRLTALAKRLAGLLRDAGRDREGFQMLTLARELMERLAGRPDPPWEAHLELVGLYEEVASVQRQRGFPEIAISMLEKAAMQSVASPPPAGHPRLIEWQRVRLEILVELAEWRHAATDHRGAMQGWQTAENWRQAITSGGAVEVAADDSPDRARIVAGQGMAWKALGNMHEAADCLAEADAIYERLAARPSAPEQPEPGRQSCWPPQAVCLALAETCLALEWWEAAEEAAGRAWTRAETDPTGRSTGVLPIRPMAVLMEVWARTKREKAALDLGRAACAAVQPAELRLDNSAEGKAFRLAFYGRLGWLEETIGQRDAALAAYREAFAAAGDSPIQPLAGPGYPSEARSLAWRLATLEQSAGRWTEAQGWLLELRSVLLAQARRQGIDTSRRIELYRLQHSLADTSEKAGQLPDATEHLKRAFDYLLPLQEATRERVDWFLEELDLRLRLGRLYRQGGIQELAGEQFRAGLETAQRIAARYLESLRLSICRLELLIGSAACANEEEPDMWDQQARDIDEARRHFQTLSNHPAISASQIETWRANIQETQNHLAKIRRK